ncbi:hypothetical protein [Phaeobacter sp. 22II1-1F12B]|uniref:hypothetical protein n=1 Tax=Phaeobacter sp. 22II1-1F12B TaxID=1317111 RepID=UPI000B523ADF|nr:hypothetical protein [Phaeobacter sp. 22II1-1F12B]OWU66736.1 hypothetical protein ATO1_25975 [Phaeobacter sp. 22II1-1F12B]
MIRFFTIYELEQLTNDQLDELHAIFHQLLSASEPGTAERRNILASLENIDCVRNRRHALPDLSP